MPVAAAGHFRYMLPDAARRSRARAATMMPRHIDTLMPLHALMMIDY